MNADVRHTVDVIRQQGGIVTRTRGGHLRFEHPSSGKVVIASSTNPRGRGLANTWAELRRAGFTDPRRKVVAMVRVPQGATAPPVRVTKYEQLVDFVRQNPGMAPRDIAAALNESPTAVSQRAVRAVRKGLLRTEGKKSAVRYFAVEKAEPEELTLEPVVEPEPVEVKAPSNGNGASTGSELGYDFVVEVAHEALENVRRSIEHHERETRRLAVERDRLERVVSHLDGS